MRRFMLLPQILPCADEAHFGMLFKASLYKGSVSANILIRCRSEESLSIDLRKAEEGITILLLYMLQHAFKHLVGNSPVAIRIEPPKESS